MGKKSSGTDTFVIEGVTLSFPHLFALDNNGKYSSVLVMSEASAANIMQKAQALAAQHFVNGESGWPGFRWPVARCEDYMTRKGEKPYNIPRFAGMWIGSSSAQSDRPPQVVDGNRQPLLDRSQIYGGVVAAVGVRLYTFENNGNVGISIGLNAVMKQADGEALGGGGPVDVDAVFQGVQGATVPTAGPAGAPRPQGMPSQAPVPGMPTAPFPQAAAPQPAPAAPQGVPGMPPFMTGGQ